MMAFKELTMLTSALRTDIDNPSDDVIRKLQYTAVTAEEERQDLLKAYQGGNPDAASEDKSELGSISKEIEQALYQTKASRSTW